MGNILVAQGKRAAAVVGSALALLALTAGAASAQVPTEVETAVQGVFGDLQSLIVGVIAVAFFTLVIAVLAVKLGAKWGQRAVSK